MKTSRTRLIKLPLHVTEQDLKLLSAVLNASLTGLPASRLHAGGHRTA